MRLGSAASPVARRPPWHGAVQGASDASLGGGRARLSAAAGDSRGGVSPPGSPSRAGPEISAEMDVDRSQTRKKIKCDPNLEQLHVGPL
jgi:hypothetical protein